MRVFVGLAALCVVSCADRAKQSVTLYQAGDYAGAARAADEGIAQHPGDGALWGMRVRAALALGDAAGVEKAYAAYVAERGDDDRALLRDLADATVEQALVSPSVRLQIRAIETAEELQWDDFADEIAQKMNSDDDRVAATAAIAVIHGYQQAPQVADQMLHSENAEARRIAVDGVGKKIGKLAAADLEKAGNDGDARVRAAALRWLGMLHDTDAVALCTLRLHDHDDTVRAAAASALARIGLGNIAELGRQALADRALAVRLAGIDLLVAAHDDGPLIAASDDRDPRVALAAAMAVKPTRPELAAKALERAATDPDWTTRAAAANEAIAAVGKEAALDLARRLAQDKELGVRLAAAGVLAHAGERDQARVVLAAALDSDVRIQAAAELAALGDARGSAVLSEAIRDLHRTPEQRAAVAAAHVTARRVTPGLVAALADPNGLVRVEAAAALGSLAKKR
jgi:HEAT repeat protein